MRFARGAIKSDIVAVFRLQQRKPMPEMKRPQAFSRRGRRA